MEVAYSTIGEVAIQLTSDTDTWMPSLNARLISANEVVSITGLPTFDSTQAGERHFYFDTTTTTQSETCKSGNARRCSYGWLYDRTSNNCVTDGCSNNATGMANHYGYWTSSPSIGSSNNAWYVRCNGLLSGRLVDDDSDNGVRPIINVLKSKL